MWSLMVEHVSSSPYQQLDFQALHWLAIFTLQSMAYMPEAS